MVEPETPMPDMNSPWLPTVVLADDDALALVVLRAQLGGHFDCVGVASDADAAATLVAEYRPDLVILDANMPAGGAHAATPRIRSASPDTAIVILSVDETHDQVVGLVALGATTYLRKGVDSPTLIAKLLASIHAHRNVNATATVASMA
jgi:DNA-binding NarL/FixJ family response regulator